MPHSNNTVKGGKTAQAVKTLSTSIKEDIYGRGTMYPLHRHRVTINFANDSRCRDHSSHNPRGWKHLFMLQLSCPGRQVQKKRKGRQCSHCLRGFSFLFAEHPSYLAEVQIPLKPHSKLTRLYCSQLISDY
eukprot:1157896-Pelagomonas_calceolata.AAC.2